MSAVSLLSPVLTGGIQNVNFVNGRVLTAEDMTAERTANLQRQRLLANCVGDGVSYGLGVSLSTSSVSYGTQVVHVTSGAAVNRNGDVMQLPSDAEVILAASLPTAPANGGLFAPCQPPQTQLTNPGIYVLTMLPASGYQDQVPVAQLNSAGVATSCSSRYAVAGVQFRMAPVTLNTSGSTLQSNLVTLANQIQSQLNGGASAASVAPALSQFRNGLAHVCFGTEALAGYASNPFPAALQPSPLETYGLIDTLRGASLMTDCEVPLAIMYWTLSGVQFVDMWSVRRPVFRGDASEYWPVFSGKRRWVEGLACFLQFQQQLADIPAIIGTSQLGTVAANNFFYYLPAAGFIPMGSVNPAAGFDYIEFFSGRTYRNPLFMEGARFDSLLHSSFSYPPIDFSNQEMLWIYQARENQEAIDNGTSVAPPYLVFTNGRVPFQGEAQYDLNYFNYANYM